jgi:hypothetical protein
VSARRTRFEEKGETKRVTIHVMRGGLRRRGWARVSLSARLARERARYQTHLGHGDELAHVPHALLPRLPSLPEQLSERRGVQRRAAVGTSRLFVLAERVEEHLLPAVAVEAVPAGVQHQHDVRARAREGQRVEAHRAQLRPVHLRARLTARAHLARKPGVRQGGGAALAGALLFRNRPYPSRRGARNARLRSTSTCLPLSGRAEGARACVREDAPARGCPRWALGRVAP